ncbi:hypothetical protein [Priestia aryabhattai]|uniref:hypothetical protein n=1 Tax=Priestia aryabhattai TaxID=412384 RepID=UPI000BF0F72D|nr:hypothetical protein [Priestia aryabhattai]PEI51130.1 hypothetical protein CN635_25265 [Priestia aryabhattai]
MNELIRSYDYKTLRKTLGNTNYLLDIRKFEVYFSLICSLIVTGIIIVFATTNLNDNQVKDIVTTTQNILLNSTFGLLGMLGFIISGLAIISGTIGNKVTHQIIQQNKFQSLLSILFSFFYIGRFVGITIILFVASYFIVGISLQFNIYLYGIMSFLLSYCLFFSIFFSVSLLGTCLNIFVLNFLYSQEEQTINRQKDVESLFNDIRIDAITAILNRKFNVGEEEFIQSLIERIETDCPREYQESLKNKLKEYYSREDK